MARIKKTSLTIEVTNDEYHVKYTGSLIEPQTKEQRKHNERLMWALLASDELLTFCYNIVMPVVRYKRREARKKERGKMKDERGKRKRELGRSWGCS